MGQKVSKKNESNISISVNILNSRRKVKTILLQIKWSKLYKIKQKSNTDHILMLKYYSIKQQKQVNVELKYKN